jgi:hypothetical protein
MEISHRLTKTTKRVLSCRCSSLNVAIRRAAHHKSACFKLHSHRSQAGIRQFAKEAAHFVSAVELVLSEEEAKLFRTLGTEGKLLEQERISLQYAKQRLHNTLSPK